jgi:hypothetical protein
VVEENMWTKEGMSDGRVEKTTYQGASEFVLFAKYN